MERRSIDIACNMTIAKEKIAAFMRELLNDLSPTRYMTNHTTNGKYIKYNFEKMMSALEIEIDSAGEIMIDWEGGYFWVRSCDNNQVININMLIDDEVVRKVHALIDEFIIQESFLASEVNSVDSFIQNSTQIEFLESFGENPDEYQKRNGVLGIEIDTEKNPGYCFNVRGFSLGAFYRMWFGKEAYEFLDKEALRNFPCYENVVLDNDVTRITLYENILDYKKKENREKQWEFRRTLKIDEIAHRMQEEEKEEQRRNADPEVNILQGNFEHGGIRLFQTFLKDGKNVRRSQADSVEEMEYAKDGKVVFRTIRKL